MIFGGTLQIVGSWKEIKRGKYNLKIIKIMCQLDNLTNTGENVSSQRTHRYIKTSTA